MICSACGKEYQIVQINKTKAVCICTADCNYNKGSNVIVIDRHYSQIAKPDKKEVATANKHEDIDEYVLEIFNNLVCNNADYNSASEGRNLNNFQDNNLAIKNLEIEPSNVNNFSESFTNSTNFNYTDTSSDFLNMFLPESNK